MEPDVDFVGIRIPPNTAVSFGDRDRRDDSPSSSSPDDSDSDGNAGAGAAMPLVDGVALVHATQVALGPNPAPGRHTVMAIRSPGGTGKGRAFPIGTLEAGKTEQFSIDLMWSMLRGDGGSDGSERIADGGVGFGDISFMHTGMSDVYITGYKTVTTLLDGEGGYSSGEEGEVSSDDFSSSDAEEESDDDEEEAPLGVPLRGRKGGGELSSSDEDDDDESDESDDESDESDEEGDESESESEEEEEEGAPPRTPAGVKRPLGGARERRGGVGGGESGSESDDEDDEQPAAAPPATKKAKQEGGGSASASSSAAAAAAEAYRTALRDFLEAHGPTKLGALGAAVKKPAGLPPTKLTAFLSERKAEFAMDGELRVSLRS